MFISPCFVYTSSVEYKIIKNIYISLEWGVEAVLIRRKNVNIDTINNNNLGKRVILQDSASNINYLINHVSSDIQLNQECYISLRILV